MTDNLEPPPGRFDDDDHDVVSIDRERARRGKPAGPGSGWESSRVYETRGRGNAKETAVAPTAGNLALHLINEPAWGTFDDKVYGVAPGS